MPRQEPAGFGAGGEGGLMFLLCSLLGHVFRRPPERVAEYVYGDCSRCGRDVVVYLGPHRVAHWLRSLMGW